MILISDDVTMGQRPDMPQQNSAQYQSIAPSTTQLWEDEQKRLRERQLQDEIKMADFNKRQVDEKLAELVTKSEEDKKISAYNKRADEAYQKWLKENPAPKTESEIFLDQFGGDFNKAKEWWYANVAPHAVGLTINFEQALGRANMGNPREDQFAYTYAQQIFLQDKAGGIGKLNEIKQEMSKSKNIDEFNYYADQYTKALNNLDKTTVKPDISVGTARWNSANATNIAHYSAAIADMSGQARIDSKTGLLVVPTKETPSAATGYIQQKLSDDTTQWVKASDAAASAMSQYNAAINDKTGKYSSSYLQNLQNQYTQASNIVGNQVANEKYQKALDAYQTKPTEENKVILQRAGAALNTVLTNSGLQSVVSDAQNLAKIVMKRESTEGKYSDSGLKSMGLERDSSGKIVPSSNIMVAAGYNIPSPVVLGTPTQQDIINRINKGELKPEPSFLRANNLIKTPLGDIVPGVMTTPGVNTDNKAGQLIMPASTSAFIIPNPITNQATNIYSPILIAGLEKAGVPPNPMSWTPEQKFLALNIYNGVYGKVTNPEQVSRIFKEQAQVYADNVAEYNKLITPAKYARATTSEITGYLGIGNRASLENSYKSGAADFTGKYIVNLNEYGQVIPPEYNTANKQLFESVVKLPTPSVNFDLKSIEKFGGVSAVERASIINDALIGSTQQTKLPSAVPDLGTGNKILDIDAARVKGGYVDDTHTRPVATPGGFGFPDLSGLGNTLKPVTDVVSPFILPSLAIATAPFTIGATGTKIAYDVVTSPQTKNIVVGTLSKVLDLTAPISPLQKANLPESRVETIPQLSPEVQVVGDTIVHGTGILYDKLKGMTNVDADIEYAKEKAALDEYNMLKGEGKTEGMEEPSIDKDLELFAPVTEETDKILKEIDKNKDKLIDIYNAGGRVITSETAEGLKMIGLQQTPEQMTPAHGDVFERVKGGYMPFTLITPLAQAGASKIGDLTEELSQINSNLNLQFFNPKAAKEGTIPTYVRVKGGIVSGEDTGVSQGKGGIQVTPSKEGTSVYDNLISEAGKSVFANIVKPSLTSEPSKAIIDFMTLGKENIGKSIEKQKEEAGSNIQQYANLAKRGDIEGILQLSGKNRENEGNAVQIASMWFAPYMNPKLDLIKLVDIPGLPTYREYHELDVARAMDLNKGKENIPRFGDETIKLFNSQKERFDNGVNLFSNLIKNESGKSITPALMSFLIPKMGLTEILAPSVGNDTYQSKIDEARETGKLSPTGIVSKDTGIPWKDEKGNVHIETWAPKAGENNGVGSIILDRIIDTPGAANLSSPSQISKEILKVAEAYQRHDYDLGESPSVTGAVKSHARENLDYLASIYLQGKDFERYKSLTDPTKQAPLNKKSADEFYREYVQARNSAGLWEGFKNTQAEAALHQANVRENIAATTPLSGLDSRFEAERIAAIRDGKLHSTGLSYVAIDGGKLIDKMTGESVLGETWKGINNFNGTGSIILDRILDIPGYSSKISRTTTQNEILKIANAYHEGKFDLGENAGETGIKSGSRDNLVFLASKYLKPEQLADFNNLVDPTKQLPSNRKSQDQLYADYIQARNTEKYQLAAAGKLFNTYNDAISPVIRNDVFNDYKMRDTSFPPRTMTHEAKVEIDGRIYGGYGYYDSRYAFDSILNDYKNSNTKPSQAEFAYVMSNAAKVLTPQQFESVYRDYANYAGFKDVVNTIKVDKYLPKIDTQHMVFKDGDRIVEYDRRGYPIATTGLYSFDYFNKQIPAGIGMTRLPGSYGAGLMDYSQLYGGGKNDMGQYGAFMARFADPDVKDAYRIYFTPDTSTVTYPKSTMDILKSGGLPGTDFVDVIRTKDGRYEIRNDIQGGFISSAHTGVGAWDQYFKENLNPIATAQLGRPVHFGDAIPSWAFCADCKPIDASNKARLNAGIVEYNNKLSDYRIDLNDPKIAADIGQIHSNRINAINEASREMSIYDKVNMIHRYETEHAIPAEQKLMYTKEFVADPGNEKFINDKYAEIVLRTQAEQPQVKTFGAALDAISSVVIANAAIPQITLKGGDSEKPVPANLTALDNESYKASIDIFGELNKAFSTGTKVSIPVYQAKIDMLNASPEDKSSVMKWINAENLRIESNGRVNYDLNHMDSVDYATLNKDINKLNSYDSDSGAKAVIAANDLLLAQSANKISHELVYGGLKDPNKITMDVENYNSIINKITNPDIKKNMELPYEFVAGLYPKPQEIIADASKYGFVEPSKILNLPMKPSPFAIKFDKEGNPLTETGLVDENGIPYRGSPVKINEEKPGYEFTPYVVPNTIWDFTAKPAGSWTIDPIANLIFKTTTGKESPVSATDYLHGWDPATAKLNEAKTRQFLTGIEYNAMIENDIKNGLAIREANGNIKYLPTAAKEYSLYETARNTRDDFVKPYSEKGLINAATGFNLFSPESKEAITFDKLTAAQNDTSKMFMDRSKIETEIFDREKKPVLEKYDSANANLNQASEKVEKQGFGAALTEGNKFVTESLAGVGLQLPTYYNTGMGFQAYIMNPLVGKQIQEKTGLLPSEHFEATMGGGITKNGIKYTGDEKATLDQKLPGLKYIVPAMGIIGSQPFIPESRFVEGMFNYPKEHPIEMAALIATPAVFEAGSYAVGSTRLGLAGRLAGLESEEVAAARAGLMPQGTIINPTIVNRVIGSAPTTSILARVPGANIASRALANRWLPDIVKTAVGVPMALGFAKGEVEKVSGYDVLTGKPLLPESELTQAKQWGRAGTVTGDIFSLYEGGKLAGHIKYAGLPPNPYPARSTDALYGHSPLEAVRAHTSFALNLPAYGRNAVTDWNLFRTAYKNRYMPQETFGYGEYSNPIDHPNPVLGRQIGELFAAHSRETGAQIPDISITGSSGAATRSGYGENLWWTYDPSTGQYTVDPRYNQYGQGLSRGLASPEQQALRNMGLQPGESVLSARDVDALAASSRDRAEYEALFPNADIHTQQKNYGWTRGQKLVSWIDTSDLYENQAHPLEFGTRLLGHPVDMTPRTEELIRFHQQQTPGGEVTGGVYEPPNVQMARKYAAIMDDITNGRGFRLDKDTYDAITDYMRSTAYEKTLWNDMTPRERVASEQRMTQSLNQINRVLDRPIRYTDADTGATVITTARERFNAIADRLPSVYKQPLRDTTLTTNVGGRQMLDLNKIEFTAEPGTALSRLNLQQNLVPRQQTQPQPKTSSGGVDMGKLSGKELSEQITGKLTIERTGEPKLLDMELTEKQSIYNLPPVKQGYVRLIHATNAPIETLTKIGEMGIRYEGSSMGGIDSTAIKIGDSTNWKQGLVKYISGSEIPLMYGKKIIIFDMPEKAYNSALGRNILEDTGFKYTGKGTVKGVYDVSTLKPISVGIKSYRSPQQSYTPTPPVAIKSSSYQKLQNIATDLNKQKETRELQVIKGTREIVKTPRSYTNMASNAVSLAPLLSKSIASKYSSASPSSQYARESSQSLSSKISSMIKSSSQPSSSKGSSSSISPPSSPSVSPSSASSLKSSPIVSPSSVSPSKPSSGSSSSSSSPSSSSSVSRVKIPPVLIGGLPGGGGGTNAQDRINVGIRKIFQPIKTGAQLLSGRGMFDIKYKVGAPTKMPQNTDKYVVKANIPEKLGQSVREQKPQPKGEVGFGNINMKTVDKSRIARSIESVFMKKKPLQQRKQKPIKVKGKRKLNGAG